jgi:hypothetical protein
MQARSKVHDMTDLFPEKLALVPTVQVGGPEPISCGDKSKYMQQSSYTCKDVLDLELN